MIRHTRWAPLVLVLSLALTACGGTGNEEGDSASSPTRAQPSPTTVPTGTQDKIMGEDQSTPVITYTLPWTMKLGVVDRDSMFIGNIPNQADYMSTDGQIAVLAGLISPNGDPVFEASDAVQFDIKNNFENIATPLVEGTLGGGSVVAMACHDRTGLVGRERLMVFSTTEGLAWILVGTNKVDPQGLHKFLASIKVLHPGPTAGWFKPAPATTKSEDPGVPICETDAAKATIGVASDK